MDTTFGKENTKVNVIWGDVGGAPPRVISHNTLDEFLEAIKARRRARAGSGTFTPAQVTLTAGRPTTAVHYRPASTPAPAGPGRPAQFRPGTEKQPVFAAAVRPRRVIELD